MAVIREVPCSVCKGNGWLSQVWDGGASSERCRHCDASGTIKVAITNNARINELDTPEAKLRFYRGFQKWAKYAGDPRRLIFPGENDAEMLEWLNKISDETDDLIFENR